MLSSVWVACIASVSVQFWSKEQGTRAKDRTKKGRERARWGWGRKEGNASRQNLRFWKLPTNGLSCLSAHTDIWCCHQLSYTVYWPIKCLAFHRGKVNFWGYVWNQNKVSQLVKLFQKQCADGRNGEISMIPNDQCRLCNCSFKVKFVKIYSKQAIFLRKIFWLHQKRRNAMVKF